MVDPKYRNVLCPWQTDRDIRSQGKFLDKMLKSLNLPAEDEKRLLLLDKPDFVWKPKG